MKEDKMTLNTLTVGESCMIRQVGNQRGAVKRRLVDMGLTPGTAVKLVKVAPLGDPLEVSLRGYDLSLRREDAAQILVEPLRGEEKPEPVPAARSTSTWWPAWTKALTAPGVSPTRNSLFLISFGNPMIMRITLSNDLGHCPGATGAASLSS